jgi:hypothetical protein
MLHHCIPYVYTGVGSHLLAIVSHAVHVGCVVDKGGRPRKGGGLGGGGGKSMDGCTGAGHQLLTCWGMVCQEQGGPQQMHGWQEAPPPKRMLGWSHLLAMCERGNSLAAH